MKASVFPLLHAAVLAAALVMPGAGAFAQAMSADNAATPGLLGQVQVTGGDSNTTGDGHVAMPVILRTLQGLPTQGNAVLTQPAQPAAEQDGVPGTAAPSRTMCGPVPGPGIG